MNMPHRFDGSESTSIFRRRLARSLAGWALTCAGCTGTIMAPGPGGGEPVAPGATTSGSRLAGDPGGQAAGGPGSGTAAGQGVAPPGATDTGGATPGGVVPAGPPAPGPLLRLTRLEYNNTVQDLLGDASSPANVLGPEPAGESGFETPIAVGPTQVEALRDLAEGIAQRAVTLGLARILPCDPARMGEDACARQFIAAFARRAFRRPVDSDEQAGLEAIYAQARTTLKYDFAGGVRMVITAVLQSPPFLYHWEVGVAQPLQRDGALVRLTPHQLASRLSYFLWRSMPDDELAAAADAGRLGTPEQVEAQARRLVASPRAQAALGDFAVQLLKLGGLPDQAKDPQRFPAFAPDLRRAALDETQRLVAGIIADPRGTLADLFTSTGGAMTDGLRKLYGGKTANDRQAIENVTLDPTQRAGWLTRVAFLASAAKPSDSNPIARGKLLRTRILCQTVPPPPAMIPLPPPLMATQTGRQLQEAHLRDPGCRACHSLMDPQGFAFENYDAIGAYRQKDNGVPVDASGQLIGLAAGPIAFTSAIDLSRALADTVEARGCVTRQLLRYGTGRLDDVSDSDTVAAIVASSNTGATFALQTALLALVRSRSFTHRVPSPGESLP